MNKQSDNELRFMAERLPHTKDGVPVVPGDTVYDYRGCAYVYEDHCKYCECDKDYRTVSGSEIHLYYSTIEAANKCRKNTSES